MKQYRILVINPGSTTTKIAVFDNLAPLFIKEVVHESTELDLYPRITDQFTMRKEAIINALREEDVDIHGLSAIVGRGGLIRPVESGVYEVNEAMKNDLRNSPLGEHASNLGGLIASDLATDIEGVRAFVADPVVVDEMDPVARLTGHPYFERRSIFHALNHKAIGRLYAKSLGRRYDDMNLIIVHLGGGTSVAAHHLGRVVDTTNALDGEGPFSPERSGTLPVGDLVKLCFSGKYTQAEVKKMVKGEGGLVAHLGSNGMLEALGRSAEGDTHAQLVIDAYVYNVAKYIGAMATVLKGQVDAVIITGGIARSELICSSIKASVGFIAPVIVYPGENEMAALAENGLMVLSAEVEPRVYGV